MASLRPRPSWQCIIFIFLPLGAGIAPTQATNQPVLNRTQALDLEKNLFRAFIDADVPKLDSLTAREFVYNHGDAHTDTKSEMLQRMSSGIAKFVRIERLATASAPHDRETEVFVYPDTVVITGKVIFVVSMFQHPEQTAHDRLTTIWARSAAGWQMILWHATPIPVISAERGVK